MESGSLSAEGAVPLDPKEWRHIASELKLIDRTLSGDREAFAELIEEYLGLVHGIILNKVRRPDEVEDLVQDVFVKAFQ